MSLRPVKENLQLATNTQGRVRVATIQVDNYRFKKNQLVDDTLKTKMMLLSLTPTGPKRENQLVDDTLKTKMMFLSVTPTEGEKRKNEPEGELTSKIARDEDNKTLANYKLFLFDKKMIIRYNQMLDRFRNGTSLLQYASDELKNDEGVVHAAVEFDVNSWEYASEALRNDTEFINKLIHYWDKYTLATYLKSPSNKEVSERYRQMILRFQNGTTSLQYASDELKNNTEVVRAALTFDPNSWRFASDALRNNDELILQLNTYLDNDTLAKYKESSLNKEAIERYNQMLERFRNGASLLQHASNELKNNKAVVRAAIMFDENSWEYASEALRIDKDLITYWDKYTLRKYNTMLQAFQTQFGESPFDDELFARYKEMLKRFIDGNSVLDFASDELKNDREVMRAAVRYDRSQIKFASRDLLTDTEFLYGLIRHWQDASGRHTNQAKITYYFPYRHGTQKDEYYKEQLKLIEKLQLGDIFLFDAIKDQPNRKSNKSLVLASIQGRGHVNNSLEYASSDLKNDKYVVEMAIRHSPYALKYASDELKRDKAFIIKMMAITDPNDDTSRVVYRGGAAPYNCAPVLLRYADEALREDKDVVRAAIKYEMPQKWSSDKDLSLQYGLHRRAVVVEDAEGEPVVVEAINIMDKEVVEMAVRKNARSIEFAFKDLKEDAKFILKMMEVNRHVFLYIDKELFKNQEICLLALELNIDCDDDEIVRQLVRKLEYGKDAKQISPSSQAISFFTRWLRTLHNKKAPSVFMTTLTEDASDIKRAWEYFSFWSGRDEYNVLSKMKNELADMYRTSKEAFDKVVYIHGDILEFGPKEAQKDISSLYMAARTSKKYAILALKDMLSDLEGTWTGSLYKLHAKFMSYIGMPFEFSLETPILKDKDVLTKINDMTWDIYKNWSDNDHDGKFYQTLTELHEKISSIVDSPNNALFKAFKDQLEKDVVQMLTRRPRKPKTPTRKPKTPTLTFLDKLLHSLSRQLHFHDPETTFGAGNMRCPS